MPQIRTARTRRRPRGGPADDAVEPAPVRSGRPDTSAASAALSRIDAVLREP